MKHAGNTIQFGGVLMDANSSGKAMPDVGRSEAKLKPLFSERLHKLREDARQTQNQVAKALGFASESVYQLWEKSDGNLPSAQNLRKLALHFGVSVDYLLGLSKGASGLPEAGLGGSDETGVANPQPEGDREQTRRLLFQLALSGHDWDDPEVVPLLINHLRRSLDGKRKEGLEECYQRILTDATYPLPPDNLPQLEVFRTPSAQAIKQEIESLFRNRPQDRARQVTMYVLDLQQVASDRLQRILIGMQGAELIKQKEQEFKEKQKDLILAVTNGRMVRNVLTAPNLLRGDIEHVTVIPLTLGRSRYDETAATTLIGNFIFNHGDYGVRFLEELSTPERLEVRARSINLAFMGIGTVEQEIEGSNFATLLGEKNLSAELLKAQGVIGNVLYHLIRESSAADSWDEYQLPPGQEITRGIDDASEDDTMRSIRLETLHWLVETHGADSIILAKEPSRARIVRAALEMRWANALICTMPLARTLRDLLRSLSG